MGTVGALPTLGSIGAASVKKRKTQTGTDAGIAKKFAGGAFQYQEIWGSGGIDPGNAGTNPAGLQRTFLLLLRRERTQTRTPAFQERS